MIKSATLENFQSHKDTKFDFHPGINAIIGASNKGKSAVLRALYWCVYNRPSADPLISHWAVKDEKQIATMSVSVEKESGSCTRIRNTNVNGYTVNGTKYGAIKTDVPEAVQRFFDISEVNIQKQMDAPFLLSENAGEIARFFNRIIKLEDIDKALSLIESKRRASKADISRYEENLSGYKAEYERYAGLKDIQEKVSVFEKTESRAIEKMNQRTAIQTLLSTIDNNGDLARRAGKITALESIIEEYETLESDIAGRKNNVLILNSLISLEYSAKKDIEKADTILSLQSDIGKYDKISDSIQKKTSQVSALSAIIKGIKQAKISISSSDSIVSLSEFIEKQEKYAEKISDMKEKAENIRNILLKCEKSNRTMEESDENISELKKSLPKTCPLCGNTLKK